MQSKISVLFAISIAVSAALHSCRDLLEEDLEKVAIEILAPADLYNAPSPELTFSWRPVVGATDYRLELASPSADAATVFDRLEANEEGITVSLAEGTYEWRTVASNSAYQTNSAWRKLEVRYDSLLTLADRQILLSTPEENQKINTLQVLLSWNELSEADLYRIQLSSDASYFLDTTSTVNSISVLLDEGSYQLKVRGENSTNNTPFTMRSFEVDTTAPEIVDLLSPLDNETQSNPVSMSWSQRPDATSYTVEIRADSINGSIELQESLINTSTTANGLDVDRTYFWFVTATDPAGNTSAPSVVRSFFVTQ